MPANEVFLDVSLLEPPEPLVNALSACATLPRGHYLRLHHRRFPCLLPENLEQRGFAYLFRTAATGGCDTFIWATDDRPARTLAETAAKELAPWQEP